MKSGRRGKRTSKVEVTNISSRGFWLLLAGRELFIPFAEFPWFRDASIAQLVDVQLPGAHHLYWPRLDVDLAVESIEHPDRYPLVSNPPGSTPVRRPEAQALRERRPAYTPGNRRARS